MMGGEALQQTRLALASRVLVQERASPLQNPFGVHARALLASEGVI